MTRPAALDIGALARLILVTSLLTTSARAEDWIVDDDGGPGVDFVDLQAAIDAASDRDVILIRPGLYSRFSISGKSLTLAGDGSGTVSIGATTQDDSWIENLAVGAAVELSGLDFDNERYGLRVWHNEGSVWFSDCRIMGYSPSDWYGGGHGGTGINCFNSNDVGFIRCTIRGGDGDTGCYESWLCADGGLGRAESCVASRTCSSSTAKSREGAAARRERAPDTTGARLKRSGSTRTQRCSRRGRRSPASRIPTRTLASTRSPSMRAR